MAKHKGSKSRSARRAQAEQRLLIARATVPPRARDDLAGAVLAGEIWACLRGLSEAERMATLERAINDGNVAIMAAALEQPLLSGLSPERSSLLASRPRPGRPDQLHVLRWPGPRSPGRPAVLNLALHAQ